MPDDKPDFLVCALADQSTMVRGSIFTKLCSKCGTRVMVAPSGQRVLALYPDLGVMCLICYLALAASTETENRLADRDEVIMQDLDTVVPNTWKERN